MIMDKDNMFSLEQAVTVTAASADTVDLGPGDAGPAERLSLLVSARPPFTGAGALTVELQTADEADAGGVLTGPVTVASFPVAGAALTGGGRLVAARLPHGCKRYLRLNYVVSGSLADGEITAGLVWDVEASV